MTYIPEDGELYYYLTEEGRVCQMYFSGNQFDIDMLDKGRVFKTPQEAHLYKDKHLTVIYQWKDN